VRLFNISQLVTDALTASGVDVFGSVVVFVVTTVLTLIAV